MSVVGGAIAKPAKPSIYELLGFAFERNFALTRPLAQPRLSSSKGKNIMIELVRKHGENTADRCKQHNVMCLGLFGSALNGDLLLLSGVGVLVIGICLALGGCARELTAYGRAREADTIASYEEFIRTNPRDPRVRYARQRVEVLRLLEAQRSGPASVVGAEKMAPQEGVTVRAQPRDVRQGPWNLTTELPRRSAFTLDLHHGSIAPIPHKLRISQEGERVTYSLEHGNESNKSLLTEHIPLARFTRLWEAVVFSDVGSMKSSYGKMVSAEDYRGYLMIGIDTGTGQFSKKIHLEGLNFEDTDLTKLLNSMTQMHPKDHRMPFFR